MLIFKMDPTLTNADTNIDDSTGDESGANQKFKTAFLCMVPLGVGEIIGALFIG